jgi:hypothetical protein
MKTYKFINAIMMHCMMHSTAARDHAGCGKTWLKLDDGMACTAPVCICQVYCAQPEGFTGAAVESTAIVTGRLYSLAGHGWLADNLGIF